MVLVGVACGYCTLLEVVFADVEEKDTHTLKLTGFRLQSKMRLNGFSASLRLTPIERSSSSNAD
jgi:hypothetical protein